MNRVVAHFAAAAMAAGGTASQPLRRILAPQAPASALDHSPGPKLAQAEAASPPGARFAPHAEPLWFMRGVENSQFRSPTHSPTTEELEALKRRKRGSSKEAGRGAEEEDEGKNGKDEVEVAAMASLGASPEADVGGAAAKLDAILQGLSPEEEVRGASVADALTAPAPAQKIDTQGGKAAQKRLQEKPQSGGEKAAQKRLQEKPQSGGGRATKEAGPSASKPRRQRATVTGTTTSSAPTQLDAGPRRIPARLLPWPCSLCTFENKGCVGKCEMCSTAKATADQAAPPQEEPPAADASQQLQGSPDSPRQRLQQRGAPTLEAPTAARGQGRQRKMSGGAAAAAARPAKRARPSADGAKPVSASKPTAAAAGGASLPPRGVWRDERSRSVVLLGSGLGPAGKVALQLLADASGATVVLKWDPKVTHLVCATTIASGAGKSPSRPQSRHPAVFPVARRTFKYLRAVLAGCWIVGEAWMEACMAEGRFVEELYHEVGVGRDESGRVDGPRRGRVAAAAGTTPLLRGYTVQLQGRFAKRAEVAELLKAAGAEALPSSATVSGSKSARELLKTFVLCEEPEGGGGPPKVAAWWKRASAAGLAVVSARWLMDCIAAHRVLPAEHYLLS
jgi:hypothetical protein